MSKAWKYTILLFVFFFMLVSSVQQVHAADTKKVTGTCEYDKAYEVLDIVNKKRKAKGLGKLKMDKQLLEVAMMRAAETTVKFDHTRPNGQLCFTACDKMRAENIAYGYGTATHVMEGWMDSPGHKRNIMNSSYQSIGIGCFEKNGVRYWVQCFGEAEANTISEPSNVKQTYQVSLTSGVETTIANSDPLATKVQSFKATAGKKKLTLKWKKKTGIDGYELQISTGKKFKQKQTYKIKKAKKKKTITTYNGSKLQSNKKYYIRIRAYKNVTNDDGTVTVKYSKWKTINKKTK